MSDDEYDSNICPLCVEEMDLSDKNFLPCPCGYRVCMWCWHHIRENLNGLCPACRTPYNADPHLFAAVDRQEVVKKNRERKQKEKQEKKVGENGKSSKIIDRKHLHNFRVVQRNLVYVLGLPAAASSSEVLRKPEYFGQYGKITKIVVHNNPNLSQNTISAYVTFSHKEDALAAIQALDGFWIDGHPLRASFGTTKYCNNFIRHVPCQNPDCVYLHELGDEDDRFTKEEIQSGHSKVSLVAGKDQMLVTGQGGPSGTGKKPTGETILPPPVFLQESTPVLPSKPSSVSRSQSSSLVSAANLSTEDKDAKGSTFSTTSDISPGEKNISRAVSPTPSTQSMEQKTANAQRNDTNITNNTDESLPIASIQAPSTESASPVVAINSSNAVIVSYSEISVNPKAFNGVTWNAVFPVPASSLTVSVWAMVGKDGEGNLALNPFSKSALSFSELLDFTLPPVDSLIPRASPSTKQQIASGSSFSALRQMLPSVNLSYGNNRQQSHE